jgi:hypothetical protein
MPVPPEVAEKIRQMRTRLAETERLAGIKPVGRPPSPASGYPAEPEPAGVLAEPAPPLATLASEPARVNQVWHWILEGATEFDILEAMQQAWPEADHASLLVGAVGKIRESSRLDPTTVLGFCVEATRDLFRRMVEIGDFPGALRAIRQLRDLAK